MVTIELETIGQSVTKEDYMNKLKIYIAGPMRGQEENNFPAFYEAEKHLENKGVWNTINPARMDDELYADPLSIDYKDAMKRDLEEIFNCTAIYMLRGWEKSHGAIVEHALAVYLNLLIKYE
jgi:hypothetical protein